MCYELSTVFAVLNKTNMDFAVTEPRLGKRTFYTEH
jgi:hypothetical protein